MSRVFAYCRVSTDGQTTENQVREIEAAGFAATERRIIQETISGSTESGQRPGFMRLLDRLEAGDVLVVTKLDRLGRNAMDVRKTVDMLAGRGVRVHCLALGGVDLTSPAGRMTMQVIAAVAEFERDLLIERTKAGLERARAEGKQLGGRKPVMTDAEVQQAIAMQAEGKSISEIARHFNCSRTNVRDRIRAAKEAA
jgi:putative DNA-invertase from lambdoid prophage Rac